MIHPTAYVDPKAKLAANVAVGPSSYVGAGVTLGDNCVLHNNVTITGQTTCGEANEFFPGAVIGECPQDIKYKGEPTRLTIGDRNIFRELVTVHSGTEVGGGQTRIGSHNRFLVGVHIAHDCVVGDDCILSNYVQLAGHVHLENKVTIAGIVGIHHFTTVGTLAYVGGLTRIVADVPPFMIVEGNPSRIRGFNETGLQRWKYSEEQIRCIREAYRILFSQRAEASGVGMQERLAKLEQRPDLNGEVRYLCESIHRSLHHGIYGRQLERLRTDNDADRESFYGQSPDKAESAS